MLYIAACADIEPAILGPWPLRGLLQIGLHVSMLRYKPMALQAAVGSLFRQPKYPEGVFGLALFDPSLDGFDYIFAQIFGVGSHKSMMPHGSISLQDAVYGANRRSGEFLAVIGE